MTGIAEILKRRSHLSTGVIFAIILSLPWHGVELVADLAEGCNVLSSFWVFAKGVSWAALILVPIGALIGLCFSREQGPSQCVRRRAALVCQATKGSAYGKDRQGLL